MELLGQPEAGALPPKPGEEDGPKKGPGRPPADPTKRAINDERYRQAVELIETLPDEAKQARFAVFRASRRTEQKKDFRPLRRIMLNEWNEKNFKDQSTLRAWLQGTFGSGGYVLEPYDEHNRRMDKVAAWFVNTNPEDDMAYDAEDDDDDDDRDDDRPRDRRFRRRYRDDAHNDDILEERANVSDVLATATRQHSAQAMQANQSKDSFVSMLLLTQGQNAQAKAEEERRREDRQAEDRRLERERMDRKEKEDREERERRDRMEKEDRDRKERDDERRRQDERDERKREDERRRDQEAQRATAEAKRTEVMMATITGLAPLLLNLLKKEPPAPKESDPRAMILLKSFVDKSDRADSSQVMFQQMGEMAKLQSTMTAEQMRSMMALSGEMNSTIMKKAMDMMMASPQGQTSEGKGIIEQVMAAVQSASEIVKTLAPQPPPATIVQHQQPLLAAPEVNPNRRFARNPQQPAPAQQQQQAAQQPAQPEPEPSMPVGIPGVLHALRGIQLRAWSTTEEYQQFVQYLFTQMPLALRVAVLDANDLDIYKLTKTSIDADQVLTAWVSTPEAVPWMRTFIPSLKPTIEQMFGPGDAQRNQLRHLLAQGPQGHALALASPADFQAYIAQQKQPEPPAAAAPVPAPDAPQAPADGAAVAAPEAAQDAPPAPAEVEVETLPPPVEVVTTDSHLSELDV